ncbi:branched-chain amino acid ABC transporter permease [Sulfitobacter sp. G21635-S1]|uniref:branched-chain amino acid ABC transporter permease n=1 Tax=Sulfitobacter sp. G21635-S1 TaxID=3014043 RepID=UPI0022AFB263|nr:branched-chain amino acid ABC transporter permease [Sulfitobacter sp. G21635-S1]MCZ4256601.1 branched-chain amino acid ABC transporter permease [Sulfitobacter sp. G21635-S1]
MQEAIVFSLNVSYGIISLALLVLGLAIIFGLLGVLNMAHGELVAIGAYTAWAVQSAGLPLLLALPVAAIAAGAIGWLMEISIIRHLYRRPFDTLLATWGISILLREAIKICFGLEYKSVIEPVGGSITILGADYPTYRIWLMVAVVLGFVGLFLWYRRSHAGTRVRAMVANPMLASAVGIETAKLARRAFVLGAASAGLAGCLMAPLIRIDPYMGVDYLLSSFFVLVVGGLGSLQGVFIGSGVIGGAETTASTILGGTGGYVTVLVISILFLWLKPGGLYARR